MGGRAGKRGHFPVLSECFQPSFFKLTGKEGFYEDDILLLGWFWALRGEVGFPLAEKVLLSLKIGACLEWQRAGGLLGTDADDQHSRKAGHLSSVVFWSVLRRAVYIAPNNPQDRKTVVCCGVYELKQPLKSSYVRKVGSGEDDMLNY